MFVVGAATRLLTIPRVSNASQSPVPVGRRPIERHFQSPTASVKRLHAIYAIFCSGRTVNELALAGVGANGVNAISTVQVRERQRERVVAEQNRHTCVHASDVLERREEKHEHDAHAKDLDASSGHVQHECLHGERLCGGDGELPSAFLFQGCIGRCCCC